MAASQRRPAFAPTFLAAALCCGSSMACINEVGTTLDGEKVVADMGTEVTSSMLKNHQSPTEVAARARKVTAAARAAPSFETLNNLAAILLRLHRPEPAARLLEKLESRYPGEYSTASNLGTAYELLGRNADALKWIREGVRRNERSHEGTEWVHVRILEAKVAAAGKPISPDESVLGLDFGVSVRPTPPKLWPTGADGIALDYHALSDALRYQLVERTELVPAPDPIVASLLLDWAHLEMQAGTLEMADMLYGMAIDYGATETALIKARRKEIARIL